MSVSDPNMSGSHQSGSHQSASVDDGRTAAVPSAAAAGTAARPRHFGIGGMLAVSLLAFGFSFSLVPLYRIACEKVFGIRLERGPSDASVVASGERVDRWVTVTFDGTVNSRLPWEFGPNQLTMRVRPGEIYETTYFARNRSDRDVVGSATPSVAPARASQYFNKTECFCFTAQTLAPGQTIDMPVRFIVDPDLPADVNTVTLSYTFFKNEELTARLQAKPSVSSATSSSAADAAP